MEIIPLKAGSLMGGRDLERVLQPSSVISDLGTISELRDPQSAWWLWGQEGSGCGDRSCGVPGGAFLAPGAGLARGAQPGRGRALGVPSFRAISAWGEILTLLLRFEDEHLVPQLGPACPHFPQPHFSFSDTKPSSCQILRGPELPSSLPSPPTPPEHSQPLHCALPLSEMCCILPKEGTETHISF